MKNQLKNIAKKGSLALTAITAASVSTMAFAIDDATVTSAFDAGSTSVGVAVTGLVALVAVVVGIGMVISLLKRA